MIHVSFYFQKALHDIERLNKDHDGFPQFGLTKFSDMTEHEFSMSHLKSNSTPIARKCFTKINKDFTVREGGCAVDDDESLASIVDPKLWHSGKEHFFPERVDWWELY